MRGFSTPDIDAAVYRSLADLNSIEGIHTWCRFLTASFKDVQALLLHQAMANGLAISCLSVHSKDQRLLFIRSGRKSGSRNASIQRETGVQSKYPHPWIRQVVVCGYLNPRSIQLASDDNAILPSGNPAYLGVREVDLQQFDQNNLRHRKGGVLICCFPRSFDH